MLMLPTIFEVARDYLQVKVEHLSMTKLSVALTLVIFCGVWPSGRVQQFEGGQ